MFVCSAKFVDRFTASRLMLPGTLMPTLLLEYGVAIYQLLVITLISYWSVIGHLCFPRMTSFNL